MLVALRLVIGWHFFKEGLAHRADPNWSSEGFLRQAKGPLADSYQAMLPKFHQWDRLILAPLADKASPNSADAGDDATATKDAATKDGVNTPSKPVAVYADWLTEVNKDWKAEQDSFVDFYKLDAQQQEQANEILKQSSKQMEELMKGNKESKGYGDDIRLYRELVFRAQTMSATPGGNEIPFMKNRTAAVGHDPLGEVGLSGTSAVIGSTPAEWRADAKGIEDLYHDRLIDLLTPDQRKLGQMPADTAQIHRIDTVVSWGILIAGGCLIVGLFTRLAALAGAAFLLSVVCSQPPWIPGTVETYSQVIEMVALLALATTAVGRWGGLDYFIHLLVRPCCAAKGSKT
ncbi:MAG TPA: hypothetical protein VG056_14340 [Pirellulales bacterium]|nr:hypothetical protein [Pirellulales bacterium]